MALLPRNRCLIALATAVIVALVSVRLGPPEASDFYPIYHGAKVLLEGESPYSHQVSDHLSKEWMPAIKGQAVPVVAYPLPVLIFFSPLTFLSQPCVNFLWLSVALFILTLCLLDYGTDKLLLPFCFPPFYQVLHVQNVSLLWCALSFLVLNPKCNPIVSGVVLALLPFKAQEGIIVSAYCLYRSRREPKVTMTSLVSLASLLCLSFLWQPNWLQEWVAATQEYADKTVFVSVWILALPFFLPGIAGDLRAIGLQTTLFPINDLYRTNLLLYGWQKVPLPSRVLMAVSFIALLWYPHHNSPMPLLLFNLIPFVIVMILSAFGRIKLS